jgi:hypothetical protein
MTVAAASNSRVSCGLTACAGVDRLALYRERILANIFVTAAALPQPSSSLAAVLSRLTAGRRANNPSGRVIAALDDSLHGASPLRSQSQPRVVGD